MYDAKSIANPFRRGVGGDVPGRWSDYAEVSRRQTGKVREAEELGIA